MTRLALVALVLGALALVSGAAADGLAVCRQKGESLHLPDLICPGDSEWSEAPRSQRRPGCPWNMNALRKLYVFGDAEVTGRGCTCSALIVSRDPRSGRMLTA